MESEQISVSMSEYMGNGETILIVDDVNRQRELASRMLSKLNYRISTVTSGEEAIEYLKTNKADLIVLDMIMEPGIDGLETYENILKLNPVQKAVIVSGFSESDRVREAQRIGGRRLRPETIRPGASRHGGEKRTGQKIDKVMFTIANRIHRFFRVAFLRRQVHKITSTCLLVKYYGKYSATKSNRPPLLTHLN
jgi:CheY-like chemotaxis protein